MATFRIKTCGLTNADLSSLKSMLKLAQDNLHHNWEIVNKEDADLYVYCLDYETGISAWEQRVQALSCLLTKDSGVAPADITLNKPLRVKSFTEILNSLDQKLSKAKTDNKQINDKSETIAKTTSFLTSLSVALPARLSRGLQKESQSSNQKIDKEKPGNGISPLKLKVPEQTDKNSEVALSDTLLVHWLEALPDDNLNSKTILLLNSLINFNQAHIGAMERLHLLDIYRNTVNPLIVEFYSDHKSSKNVTQSVHQRLVNSIGQLTAELANGYKIIVSEEHDKGMKPDSDNLMLMAINRAGEQLSLSCRHAYKYYQTVPDGIFSALNEMYLLTEGVKVEDKIPVTIKKDSRAKYSFGLIYKQLLLVSVISPYNLFKGDVLKVYEIFGKLVPEVTIQPFDKQKKISSSQFFINHLNDGPPSPKLRTTDQKEISAQTRMLNAQSILTAIESIFRTAKKSPADKKSQTIVRLLKQIVPQLNTSYHRKELRIKIPEEKYVYLLPGFTNSHHYCDQHNQTQSNDNNNPHLAKSWKVLNQSSEGLLVGDDSIDRSPFLVGDIVCLYEQNSNETQIASIRWLQTNHNQFTKIGLKLFHDQTKAVQVYSDKNSKPQAAILFTARNSPDKISSIISPKDIFVADQPLYVMTTDETYAVTMNKLVEYSPYCDQFTCSDKKPITT